MADSYRCAGDKHERNVPGQEDTYSSKPLGEDPAADVKSMFSVTTGHAPALQPDPDHWANAPAETRLAGPAEGEPFTTYKIPCWKCKQPAAYVRVWAEPGDVYVHPFQLPRAEHARCPLIIVGGI